MTYFRIHNYPFTMIYDLWTAQHYGAYRPPLHRQILDKLIGEKNYATGLDIGCGTGHSAIALAAFCHHVLGIDSSQEMLHHSIKHPKVEYRHCHDMSSINASFDLVTLAGSLHYLRSQKMVDDISQLLNDHGLVLIYDFDIQVKKIIKPLFTIPVSSSNYDHQANLSGLRHSTLHLINSGHNRSKFELTSSELAHLILSETHLHTFFQQHFEVPDPYDLLQNFLCASEIPSPETLIAEVYYTVYRKETNGDKI